MWISLNLWFLQVDASDVGVGAVSSQLDEGNKDHPVAYFSRKLLPREQKYSVIEKECLAIKLSVEAFQVYLLGRRFWLKRITGHYSGWPTFTCLIADWQGGAWPCSLSSSKFATGGDVRMQMLMLSPGFYRREGGRDVRGQLIQLDCAAISEHCWL